jgi:hypothetical protein
MHRTFKIFIHIVTPIIIGSLIYLLFRPKNILVFDYFKILKIDLLINTFRTSVILVKPYDWIIFCLPGGLWLYSYTYAVGMSWSNEINKKNLFWYLLPLILSISSEFGQFLKIIRGTFDWQDIGFYTLFTILAVVLLPPKISFLKTFVK